MFWSKQRSFRFRGVFKKSEFSLSPRSRSFSRILWTYKLLCRRLTSEFGLNRLHISLILLLKICKCDISALGYFTICSTNWISWQFIEYVFSWWWRYSINMFSHLVLICCQVCCTLLELQLIECRLHVWYLSWKIFNEWISEFILTPPLWGDLCYKEASITQIKVWIHKMWFSAALLSWLCGTTSVSFCFYTSLCYLPAPIW